MGTTPNYAIPYPEPTDFVTDGAQAMENIAEKVDNILSTGAAAQNLLYNGAMNVTQRGTNSGNFSSGAQVYRTADRWATTILGTAGTWLQTIVSATDDYPGGTTGTYSGFRQSLKMSCVTPPSPLSSNATVFVNQRIEGRDLQWIGKGTSTAKQLTVSFWVKAFRGGTYICSLYDNNNGRAVSGSYVINASNTWEYKTITFPADTTGTFNNNNAFSMQISWFMALGTNYTSGTLQTTWGAYTAANEGVGQTNASQSTSDYWQITGVQLVVGATAPPFQFKSYNQELLECQRYFQKSYEDATAPGTAFTVGSISASAHMSSQTYSSQYNNHTVMLFVPMRGATTVQTFDAVGTNGATSGYNTTTAAWFNGGAWANFASVQKQFIFVANNGPNIVPYIQFAWTAASEL
jgi:hypothetical protein